MSKPTKKQGQRGRGVWGKSAPGEIRIALINTKHIGRTALRGLCQGLKDNEGNTPYLFRQLSHGIAEIYMEKNESKKS